MLKTIGSQTARLLMELNERRSEVFSIDDVREITGLNPTSARTLLHKAERRGIVHRLKPGLFSVVPLGRSTQYVPAAPAVVQGLLSGEPHYLSHGSAMELHRMVVQPQLVTTVSVQRKRPSKMVGGYEIRFVVERPEKFFGFRDVWVGDRAYKVSDLERTVVDGLRRPSFVGGITDVARGMSMRADKIDPRRVVEYLLRMNVGAAIRRGGFLLEELEIGNADDLAPLRDRLTATYETLDPTMPKDGGHDARWKLLLNVSREEIQAVRST